MQKNKQIEKIITIFIILILILMICSSIVSANEEQGNFVAKTYIESPANTAEAGKINLQGWIMSNDEQSEIKAYIDEQEVEITSLTRQKRQDVINEIKGYGTQEQNPTPGFRCIIDEANIQEGQHTISIKIFSSEGKEIAKHTRTFYYEKVKAQLYIESPAKQNEEITIDNKMLGWVMSNDENIKIKVFLNDEEQIIENMKRCKRQDVIDAIKGYGTIKENPTPGYRFSLNLENIEDGEYELKIQVLSESEEILTEKTRNIKVNKYKAKTYIEYPADIETVRDINLNGWIMTNDEQATIKVYVDESEVKTISEKRVQRQDVIDAIKGYGTQEQNPTPGIKYIIDSNDIKNGEHKITIKVFSREEKLIAEHSRMFRLEYSKAKVYIEYPVNVAVAGNFNFNGWMMTNDDQGTVKIYVDGIEKNIISEKRSKRPDVLNAIKGYGTEKQNPTPGFNYLIDSEGIENGNHEITIKVFSRDNKLIAEHTKQFMTEDYKAKIYIESPLRNEIISRNKIVSGWVMSNDRNASLKIYLNGEEQNIENIKRCKRQDVINAIKEYGTIVENPTPGFAFDLDLTGRGNGQYEIKIELISEDGTVLTREIRNVTLKYFERETIIYGQSGAKIRGVGGTELECYKYGDGPNVLFATFCVHGYEDAWDRDGGVLVEIANEFYNRLLQEQDLGIGTKWTIYIFPEVNPDGRRLGYTKNGPGRTTLYSSAAKGIDMNRCWQTGSSYTRYTNNRNYNGTAGFQAYEAASLRNFLLQHKATNGQTVLVDLHGWLEQLIGDEGICKYYAQQYPSNTKSYGRYGVQYLIAWARANLGAKVALVELPEVTSYQDVINMNLKNKYIEATLNMLRGI